MKRLDSAAGATELAAARGFCLSGRVAGEEELAYILLPGRNLVGSGPGNQVILERDGVSRQHAVVLLDGDRLEVADQDSKNGTFVNGRRIEHAELALGDRLWFGPVELRLEEADPEDALLALEVTGEADGRQPRSTPETTGLVDPPASLEADRQLRLVRRFLEYLDRDPHGEAAPALAALIDELGAAGAGLVEVAGDGEPVILAACGEIDAGLVERVRRASRDRRKRSFFTGPEGTGLAVSLAEGSLGLVAAGDFAGRRESEPLLRTLLSIYDCLRPRPLHDFGPAPGESPALRFPPGYVRGVAAATARLHGQMRPLVVGDLPVLIQGETGVGKEVIARTLHASSPRRRAPFVAINCAAIPAELLEAELFGIGPGVATGVKARPGKFQLAEGGTLLLDEIGEMAPELQAKLLRALQEKEVSPVGSLPVPIDVRLLAATNAEILERMERGHFRRDLFYRLAGFVLRVPPLRDRGADIPLLVERFLRIYSQEIEKPIRGITVGALRALGRYGWPGNVRELEHEIRRLVYLCPPGQAVTSASISEHILRPASAPRPTTPGAERPARDRARTAEPPTVSPPASEVPPAPPADQLPTLDLSQLEERAVDEAMRRSGGNQVEAAKLLGISRYALRRRL